VRSAAVQRAKPIHETRTQMAGGSFLAGRCPFRVSGAHPVAMTDEEGGTCSPRTSRSPRRLLRTRCPGYPTIHREERTLRLENRTPLLERLPLRLASSPVRLASLPDPSASPSEPRRRRGWHLLMVIQAPLGLSQSRSLALEFVVHAQAH
jgi:hypothetical protein